MRHVGVWVTATALTVSVSVGLTPASGADKPRPIAAGMTVTMEYTLTLPDKTVADTTQGREPFSYVHGKQQIIPGLEKALTGLKPGEKKHITVAPEEGYGLYDAKRKLTVPKANVPPEVKVGTVLRSQDGQPATVLEITEDSVVVDTNHPLAGKPLVFDVTILKVEKPMETPQKTPH